ncbi:hypothetical protein B0H17DRAFT_670624 [Mycena rosella]|uniref:Uncharacterized protein n=1 Tax=Mycena rosella TaxID=1033263 RepID=A0AAD7GUF9_MYCRO|nr:hypothetical protein B0H17DRAFT_670624 [Mycena rosella]
MLVSAAIFLPRSLGCWTSTIDLRFRGSNSCIANFLLNFGEGKDPSALHLPNCLHLLLFSNPGLAYNILREAKNRRTDIIHRVFSFREIISEPLVSPLTTVWKEIISYSSLLRQPPESETTLPARGEPIRAGSPTVALVQTPNHHALGISVSCLEMVSAELSNATTYRYISRSLALQSGPELVRPSAHRPKPACYQNCFQLSVL